jgi:hypothetical protein
MTPAPEPKRIAVAVLHALAEMQHGPRPGWLLEMHPRHGLRLR